MGWSIEGTESTFGDCWFRLLKQIYLFLFYVTYSLETEQGTELEM
jgi:hypothetical protein